MSNPGDDSEAPFSAGQILPLNGLVVVAAVVADDGFTCAVLDDQTVRSRGEGADGRTGLATGGAAPDVPGAALLLLP